MPDHALPHTAFLLHALACIHLATAPATAQLLPQAGTSYVKSSDLGISYCALKSRLNQEAVTLHVWVRLGLGAAPRSLMLRGFALLEGDDSVPPLDMKGAPKQMAHALSHRHLSTNFYLRSSYTKNTYNLTVGVPWAGPPKKAPEWAPGQAYINRVVDIWGNMTLLEGDSQEMDFELRVEGFRWFCHLIVEPAHLASWHPSANSSRHVPARRFFQRIRPGQPTSSQLRRLRGDGVNAGPTQTPTLPRSRDDYLQPVAGKASLTKSTQVWTAVSSNFQLEPKTLGYMLWHHVSWHTQLGAGCHVVYVTGELSGFLSEPLIQALVAAHRLVLVHFIDLPTHETELYHPTIVDNYLLQIIMYNHAVLALWGTDSLLMVADLDEFLTTPYPTTVVQIYQNAAAEHNQTLSGIRVPRSNTVCGLNSQCDPEQPYKQMWLAAHPLDVECGRTRHPFTHLALPMLGQNGKKNKTLHDIVVNTKSILDPNLVCGVHVHISEPSPGTLQAPAPKDIRMAHLANLLGWRASQKTEPIVMHGDGYGGNWLWPADNIMHHRQDPECQLLTQWFSEAPESATTPV